MQKRPIEVGGINLWVGTKQMTVRTKGKLKTDDKNTRKLFFGINDVQKRDYRGAGVRRSAQHVPAYRRISLPRRWGRKASAAASMPGKSVP